MAKSGKLIWHTKEIRKVVSAGRKGLLKSGKEILKVSKQLVPIDDRELIDNALVDQETSGDLYSVAVSYGNDPISAEYAVEQHENLEYNHAPGKTAKYLETPFKRIAPLISDMVGESIKGVL